MGLIQGTVSTMEQCAVKHLSIQCARKMRMVRLLTYSWVSLARFKTTDTSDTAAPRKTLCFLPHSLIDLPNIQHQTFTLRKAWCHVSRITDGLILLATLPFPSSVYVFELLYFQEYLPHPQFDVGKYS